MKSKEELMQLVESCLFKESRRRDFRPLYKNREAMRDIVKILSEPYRGKIDYVASPESMGFFLGSMIASELDVGFIAMRNGNASSVDRENEVRASYIDHRNVVRSLTIPRDIIEKGSRILMVDDWVETASTLNACVTLIEEEEARLCGVAALGADYTRLAPGRMDFSMFTGIYLA